ncbi:UNVERIFIED_CONTAM: hypothetical protein FKN15_073449 [Acipenser sinensis]
MTRFRTGTVRSSECDGLLKCVHASASAPSNGAERHALFVRVRVYPTQLGRVPFHVSQSDHQCIQHDRTSRHGDINPFSNLERL